MGRFSGLLARVPVHVMLDPKAALVGAACYGLGTYGDRTIVEQER